AGKPSSGNVTTSSEFIGDPREVKTVTVDSILQKYASMVKSPSFKERSSTFKAIEHGFGHSDDDPRKNDCINFWPFGIGRCLSTRGCIVLILAQDMIQKGVTPTRNFG
nr:hypothetical protein [Tanacetum cinerariifolium]